MRLWNGCCGVYASCALVHRGLCMSYTKGPWNEAGYGLNGGLCIHAKDTDGENFEVCEVWGIENDDCHDERSEANARLISACPDLIAALEFISNADLSSQDSGNRGLALYECGNVARAAIAKALGEQV